MQRLTADYDEKQMQLIVDFVGRASELLRAETARMRERAPADGAGASDSAPLAGAKRGVLRFASGAARVHLAAGAPEGKLYRAHFSGRPPTVRVADGAVTVQYPRFSLLDFRKLGAEIALSAELPWELEFSGGISKLRASLEDLELAGLSLRGGASAVEIDLPAPKGLVPIRVLGGASRITLRRPAGTAMRVQVAGGVSSLTFDGQHIGAAGGVARLESSGAAGAADRYELEINGGASHLTVQTR